MGIDVFFNEKKLPKARNEYVAFIDIMGTRTHMKKSVRESANFIFKLHSGIISAWREKPYKNVFVYPVMDGAYITSGNKENMINILLRVFRSLSDLFLKESNSSYLYLVRGSLAFGEVIHGHNVPYEASKAFEMSLGYKDNILLGSAMIAAYDGESLAAPFGIYISDSASKGKENKGGSFKPDWKWFDDETLKVKKNISQELSQKTQAFLESMKSEEHPLHYPSDKIEKHIELTKEYFGV